MLIAREHRETGGHFPESDIHGRYSYWHLGLKDIDPRYKQLYMTDIDRMWVEVCLNRKMLLGVFELKYIGGLDTLRASQAVVFDWFENKGIPVFVVLINKAFTYFKVQRYGDSDFKTFNALEYADWLCSLRKC